MLTKHHLQVSFKLQVSFIAMDQLFDNAPCQSRQRNDINGVISSLAFCTASELTLIRRVDSSPTQCQSHHAAMTTDKILTQPLWLILQEGVLELPGIAAFNVESLTNQAWICRDSNDDLTYSIGSDTSISAMAQLSDPHFMAYGCQYSPPALNLWMICWVIAESVTPGQTAFVLIPSRSHRIFRVLRSVP